MIIKFCRDNYFPKKLEDNVLYIWGYGKNRRYVEIDKNYKLPMTDEELLNLSKIYEN